MSAMRLENVVGSLLTALSEAQHQSDRYTEWLREKYGVGNLNVLAIPNAQLGKVTIDLRVSIDKIEAPPAGRRDAPIWVFVTGADLKNLPPDSISTLHLELSVDDAEVIDLPKKSLGG